MGKGNVYVNNGNLYYIPCDGNSINRYTTDAFPGRIMSYPEIEKECLQNDCTFDDAMTQDAYEDFVKMLRNDLLAKYKSLTAANRYETAGRNQSRRVIAENNMLYIALEDNEWSIAIEVIKNEDYNRTGIQKRQFKNIYKGLLDILLTYEDTIFARSGAWTSEAITNDTKAAYKKRIDNVGDNIDKTIKPTTAYPDKTKNKEENKNE